MNTGDDGVTKDGHERLFIKELDPLAKIGINTNTPEATLDIFGNLNVSPGDNNDSGVIIGHNTENSTCDYFKMNIFNTSDNNSIHFNSSQDYNKFIEKDLLIDTDVNYILKANNLTKNINSMMVFE
jgi:hypothetical protein